MKFLCLIYSAPDAGPQDPEAFDASMEDYFALNAELRAAGRYLAAEPLQAVETARTVRVRDGRAITTDGPFAETKEHLGGFYLIDCDTMDQAVAYAERIPGARHGCVEVRPVLDLPRRP